VFDGAVDDTQREPSEVVCAQVARAAGLAGLDAVHRRGTHEGPQAPAKALEVNEQLSSSSVAPLTAGTMLGHADIAPDCDSDGRDEL
jgi:hypothetical protein